MMESQTQQQLVVFICSRHKVKNTKAVVKKQKLKLRICLCVLMTCQKGQREGDVGEKTTILENTKH